MKPAYAGVVGDVRVWRNVGSWRVASVWGVCAAVAEAGVAATASVVAHAVAPAAALQHSENPTTLPGCHHHYMPRVPLGVAEVTLRDTPPQVPPHRPPHTSLFFDGESLIVWRESLSS